MVDLALNSNFSVFLNDKNGIATVDGRDEFEQSVRVMITHFMYTSVIGESDPDKIRNKIRLQVSRVAKRHERMTDISNINISESDEDPHTYIVRINYKSDSISEFEVSE